MGRGRPATPTALKLLRGNPGKRPISKREPKPRAGTPPCPDWLDEVARKKWRQLIPELKAMGVLTVVDGDALANYCQLWSRWRRAEEFVQKHVQEHPDTGDCYETTNPNGTFKSLRKVPQVSIAHDLLQQLRAYQNEFGLTPASRTKIEVSSPGKAADEFEAFLNRKPA